MTDDGWLPVGVTARDGRLYFASLRQRGSAGLLHVFAALGFESARATLRDRHVRAWLAANRDRLEVDR